ncbi:MAG TPA: hypothetical protein VFB58_07180 [Chloroflexota bacterium]|nr:hypothetical protein [Chloroflexota bacterium]
MDEQPDVEALDLGDDLWIDLQQSREWPKYVVTWSVRRKQGDSDYPVASGRLERMPGGDPEELLAAMREDALAEAKSAVPRQQPPTSWLRRLLS